MKTAKPAEPTITRALTPERTACPHCGRPMWADYVARRTLHTLAGVTRLRLTVRRCRTTGCAGYKRPYRPEAEGAFALPRHEFGLDVIAHAHRRYAAERDAALPDDYTGPRPTGGVGGTRVGVKCLHAHYAWYLAGGDDPVGAWVAEHLAHDTGHGAGVVAGSH